MVNFFRKAPKGYPLLRVALASFGLVIVFLVLIFIIVKVPQWQVQNSGLEFKDKLYQENENRKTVAQIVGGAFVLVGLYIAWVRSKAMRDQAEVNREQQLTDPMSRQLSNWAAKTSRFAWGVFTLWNASPGNRPRTIGPLWRS